VNAVCPARTITVYTVRMAAQPLYNPTSVDRPQQGRFNDDQKSFLVQFLDGYRGLESTSKGEKCRWIRTNVFPLYIDKYRSDGPNGPDLDQLFKVWLWFALYTAITEVKRQKMTRWYYNVSNQKITPETAVHSSAQQATQKSG
jgi:hypothetical protein